MGIWRRICALSRRKQIDSEIEEELRAHIAMRTDDLVMQGMSKEAAAREARLRFGNPIATKERVVAEDASLLLESLASDFRYALRQLRRSPGFATTAILTLALGIGANATIFSLLNGFLIKPLPYPHSDRLVMVWEQLRALKLNRVQAPMGDFADYQRDNHVFSQMAAVSNAHLVLTTGTLPERVFALRTTANLFAMLNIRPGSGRVFIDADNRPGHEHVALISDALWRGRFASDPSIVGKSIVLDGEIYEVVGKLPGNLQFTIGYPNPPDVWIPLPIVADPERRIDDLQIIARLRDGVTLPQAQADMDAEAQYLEKTYHIQMGPHGEDPSFGIEVVSLREELVGNLREPLLLMLGASGFILLIACVNVMNLLLANGIGREREFAIRISLGGSRTRLVRLLLMQAILLVLLGETLGIAGSILGSQLMIRLSPYVVAKLFDVSLDWHVLGFTSGVAIIATLLFALLPALRVAGTRRLVIVQGNTHQVLGRQPGKHLRHVLVVAETAISVTLVIGAGLLIHSFLRLQETPLGFEHKGILTTQLSLPASYATPLQQRQFNDRLLESLLSLPGMEAAAITTALPIAERPTHNPFSIEGRAWRPEGTEHIAQFVNNQAVSSLYFRLMQIPLRQGRLLNNSDTSDAPPVVVVNETLVHGFFPGENPIGKHIMLGAPRPGSAWLTIVGVVGDVLSSGANNGAVAEFYTPIDQTPSAYINLLIRSTLTDPSSVLQDARAALAKIDHSIPLHDTATYDEILAQELGPRRYEMFLMAAFGGVALILAAIGLYGVVSYSVVQRTQEMGLRMAFGASTGAVITLVLRQALTLTTCGVIVGIAGSLVLRQLLASALFGIHLVDWPVLIAVIAALLVVSLSAAYLPALRAASVNPSTAMRCE